MRWHANSSASAKPPGSNALVKALVAATRAIFNCEKRLSWLPRYDNNALNTKRQTPNLCLQETNSSIRKKRYHFVWCNGWHHWTAGRVCDTKGVYLIGCDVTTSIIWPLSKSSTARQFIIMQLSRCAQIMIFICFAMQRLTQSNFW